MPRYHGIAEKANTLILDIIQDVECSSTKDDPYLKQRLIESLLRLYNLGIRTAPQATQAVVRKTAVEIASRTLPVVIGMKKVPGYKPGMTFNALTITHASQQEIMLDSDSSESE